MPIENADKPARRRCARATLVAGLAALILTAGGATGASEPPIIIPDHEPIVAAAFGGLNGRIGRKVGLPRVLSEVDAGRYQRALALQARGQWSAADRELASVSDDVLRGHVLARRYLHPAYRTPFAELKAWLDAYDDHPDAPRLHKLANSRRPTGGPGVKQPVKGYLAGTGIDTTDSDANWEISRIEPAERLSAAQKQRARATFGRFRALLSKGKLSEAARILAGPEIGRLFTDSGVDGFKAMLAAGHFAAGEDAQALNWASQAVRRSGESLPAAHWTAGLASWRMGDIERGRRHFEAVANAADGSGWMIAAGAYWAARANLAARRPEVVNHWLDIAASYPRTFYGLLARRALGYHVRFAWEPLPLTDLDVDNLMRVPGGKRAFALLQIGDRRSAEEELRRLYATATPTVAHAMLALAHAGDMPELALRLGGVVADRDGRYHDSAAYPLPSWTPQGGWAVDQALVFAIARQESAFNPQARSPAGAAGLMQLMPGTARFVAEKPVPRERLLDPQFNLALGQRYIRHLLDHDAVKGNLFLLAAAYNGGPGNLVRWQKSIAHLDDPLLFIESIPSRETRIFIERVMTNFWIYRSRVGQPSPSLDTLVAGDWPLYDALDERQSAGLR